MTGMRPSAQGAEATRKAIEHLGYVQIDTIHVIEPCHHNILYARITATTEILASFENSLAICSSCSDNAPTNRAD